MSRQLDPEQIEKLKRNWVHQKGNFDLSGTMGVENRKDELQAFEKEWRDKWRQEELQAAHKVENIFKTGNPEVGESIKRFKTTLGHVYIQTVWKGSALSSSMVFVPEIVIENEPDKPAWS